MTPSNKIKAENRQIWKKLDRYSIKNLNGQNIK